MDPAMVQALQMLSGQEKQEFGVPPTPELHPGAPHGPTPSSIPGGRVIDTLNLVALLSAQPPVPVLIVDALGGPQRLPNAMQGAFAAQPGSFQDQIQQQFAQMLQAATGGNPSLPVIVYCYDPNCWMSYNAALRAIRAGYQNVFWYRGGLWAWEQARLPVQS
jgi:rhodanese-related sulfurtransferase